MVCPWCLLFLNINLHFTIVDRLLKVFSVCCFLPFQIISTYAIGFFFYEDMLNSDHVIRDVNTIIPSRTAVCWVGSVFPSVLFCTSFCHIGPDRPGYEVPGHPPTQGGEIPECSTENLKVNLNLKKSDNALQRWLERFCVVATTGYGRARDTSATSQNGPGFP